ncbi:MAG TPA: DUF6677 family protein [Candidatus Angelobacter sp.]|jgi:hypothetical protein|nr:DUF6677 family protein [Candidatus Angelobacter sp.]
MQKTETTANTAKPASASATPATTMAIIAPALGWLIPGAGHLIQKQWIRGLLLMISIVSMFALGVAMDGKVYKANTGDLLDILGFVGDVGAGGLYILSQVLDWGNAAIAVAVADYGTKFIVVSGLLNVMAAVDAYHIAMGRKK